MLLMVAQESEAERLITTVRDGGLPVRGTHTTHAEEIAELVEQRACDLIVCCAYDPAVELNAVLARHRELAGDVPLIVIADRAGEPRSMIRAMNSGARDVTDRNDTEQLQLVVSRELADLRARRQLLDLAARLRQCEERARELVESSEEAVAFIQEGMHVHANAAYLNLFRFPSVDDAQAAALLDLIEAKDQSVVRNFLRDRQSVPPQGPAELRVQGIRADASRFAATLTAAPAEVDGEHCLRLIVRVANPSAVVVEAGGDNPDDGLPSYLELIAAIDSLVGPERRAHEPFALFYIAIRETSKLFREVGLTRGLELIGSLTAALTRLCATLGMLVRLSDDSYGLLAPELDEIGAEGLAERIRAQVRLPPAAGAKSEIEGNCDVGYIVIAGLSPPSANLLDEAFRACGGGAPAPVRPTGTPTGTQKSTSLAARTKQSAADSDAAMIDMVKWALANDRFVLVYQPIISLMGDNQENYGVLMRLNDPSDTLIEAREFIGAAILSGLIERLDKWAIRHAIKALGEHRRSGHQLNFFINLAEDSFRDPGILIWICDCLREFDVRGNWLTFVFQEALVDGNLSSLTRIVESLKTIKCRIAVNRFGASDHPQMLLQGLALDFVLLLPEFAKGLADDQNKQQRLAVLANLSREFNVKTVVTGVEDARSLTILWTAGVDYVQGNFLQRPSPNLEVAT